MKTSKLNLRRLSYVYYQRSTSHGAFPVCKTNRLSFTFRSGIVSAILRPSGWYRRRYRRCPLAVEEKLGDIYV